MDPLVPTCLPVKSPRQHVTAIILTMSVPPRRNVICEATTRGDSGPAQSNETLSPPKLAERLNRSAMRYTAGRARGVRTSVEVSPPTTTVASGR
jgi:hypothetical protein